MESASLMRVTLICPDARRRAADHVVRRASRAGGVAGAGTRELCRALAEDRQERLRCDECQLCRGARGSALLRLDRQSEAGPRREAFPAALHAATPARPLVADQSR